MARPTDPLGKDGILLLTRFLLAIIVLFAVTAHAEDIAAIRAAAEGGNTAAMVTMGALYHYGKGVQQDDAQAARWYLLAATQGHTGAQCIVGMLFLVGQGVTQNNAQAEYWLHRAAAQGDIAAQHQLNLIKQKPGEQ